jgi:proteasome lid subunit RPN8/RPN11
MPGDTVLPRAAFDRIVDHARATRPAECCGLLLGHARGGGDDGPEIVTAVAASNLSADRNRFLLDPKDHIAARRRARAGGLAVVGFYHSHPRSSAEPSASDLAEAAYPDLVHLIVSLVGDEPRLRLWRLDGNHPRELPLRVI